MLLVLGQRTWPLTWTDLRCDTCAGSTLVIVIPGGSLIFSRLKLGNGCRDDNLLMALLIWIAVELVNWGGDGALTLQSSFFLNWMLFAPFLLMLTSFLFLFWWPLRLLFFGFITGPLLWMALFLPFTITAFCFPLEFFVSFCTWQTVKKIAHFYYRYCVILWYYKKKIIVG